MQVVVIVFVRKKSHSESSPLQLQFEESHLLNLLLTVKAPERNSVTSSVHVRGARFQHYEGAANLFKSYLEESRALVWSEVRLEKQTRVVLGARNLNFLNDLALLPIPQAHFAVRVVIELAHLISVEINRYEELSSRTCG